MTVGVTTGLRTRISQPDDENARCRVSKAGDQLRDFFPLTRPSTIPSTSTVTRHSPERTAPSVRQPWTHGGRRSRPPESMVAAGPSRSSFDNVTKPLRANNRAENSHQPIRRRERKQQRFKSPGSAQRFRSIHVAVYNVFYVQRHLLSRSIFKKFRAESFDVWRRSCVAL